MNEQLETLRRAGAIIVDSYRAATSRARKEPGLLVYSDAGDGWVCESVYCARRKRIVRTSINPSGNRVC